MAGSAPQPDKQQRQEVPASLTAQQQLLQIGEQQINSFDLCGPVKNDDDLPIFDLTCIMSYYVFSLSSTEEDDHSSQAQC